MKTDHINLLKVHPMSTAFQVLFVLATSVLILTGCKDDEDIPGVPEVRTLVVTEITSNSALGGGNVTTDGGAPVISRGVVWSNQPAPSIDSHLGLRLDGRGLGVFAASITGLTADQTYYVRAFATNAVGKAYGQQVEFSSNSVTPAAYPLGTIHCIEDGAEVVPVFSPVSGRIWMDRNLGAKRVATLSNDEESYGDLYQWGRFSDGHQCRNSGTTDIISDGISPTHSDFIISSFNDNWNWLNTQNDNLWQGINGINNPCPEGFRLPTSAEWHHEELGEDAMTFTAFNSPLKLPAAGWRQKYGAATIIDVAGYYWSSTVSGANIRGLHLQINNAFFNITGRADGGSVRCIKD